MAVVVRLRRRTPWSCSMQRWPWLQTGPASIENLTGAVGEHGYAAIQLQGATNMKDKTTAERTGPAEPPVPPALLELFSDGEAVRVQGEPPPLPPGPTPAQLRERSRREQLLMAWARANGCPRHLLAKGSWAVENCRGWYREHGSWPTREEFLTSSGKDARADSRNGIGRPARRTAARWLSTRMAAGTPKQPRAGTCASTASRATMGLPMLRRVAS
jgi:hypothetical protein